MHAEIAAMLVQSLKDLGAHIPKRPLTADEVTLYLGLLRESKSYLPPEEVARLLKARQHHLGGISGLEGM